MSATTTPAIREVFVGGPFLNLVPGVGGEISTSDRERFTRIIDYFEANDATVYNAHRREAWGKEFLGAEECTALDFAEISRSDLFVAYPGAPVSPGTHVEIGWASALGKPMILLLERGKRHTFLVTGLHTVANVEYLYFDDVAEVMTALPGAIAAVMSRAPRGTAAG
jgi:nucleoside 2-deoxyribosyltransferase